MPILNLVYLNHAGTSWPKPPEVLQAANAVLDTPPPDWGDLFHDAHQAVAEFFHVDHKRLLLTPSCTAALNLAVMDHTWSAGDRVLTSHFEHHAMQRNLAKLGEQGAGVTVIPQADGELLDLNALERELQRGGVRMVALTAACNVTGQRLPIDDAIELAHRYDALTLIDGAQIAGWWDLNVTELGADLFTFAGHKGPQAPWGIGGLYVAEGISMSCPSAACEVPASGGPASCSTMPGYCDAGSANISALAGLAAGCRWLNQAEQHDRLQRAGDLMELLATQLRTLPQLTIHHDAAREKKVPSLAITHQSIAAGELALRLKSRGIITSGGFQCAPQAHLALETQTNGVVRFSAGPCTTKAEISAAGDALREICSS